MTNNDNENNEKLCGGIKRLIGSAATTRYLRALPAFRVDHDLSDFQSLLQVMDRSETKATGR
jgi:hypothetical protein